MRRRDGVNVHEKLLVSFPRSAEYHGARRGDLCWSQRKRIFERLVEL